MSDPYNAFCEHPQVSIAGAPIGPLARTTFAAKDIFDVAGHVCCCGNPTWLDDGVPATRTATAVQRLLDAGSTLVGMTKTTELTYNGTGRNDHFGTPSNPRGPGRLPGGSSSGSAVLVAAGQVDMALGSDTGGSIRIPAALCGIAGIRPTHGGIDNAGALPLAPSLDTIGGFARDLGLLRRMYEVLLDRPPARPRWTRALVPNDLWEAVDPGVSGGAKALVDGLAAQMPVDQIDLAGPTGGLDAWVQAVLVTQAAEVWQTHGDWIETRSPVLGDSVRERFARAGRLSADEVEAAWAMRRAAASRVREVVGDSCVLVFPTSPTTAPPVTVSNGWLAEWWSRVARIAAPANVAGLPQLALPAGTADGLPIGASLLGPPDTELALIDLAAAAMTR